MYIVIRTDDTFVQCCVQFVAYVCVRSDRYRGSGTFVGIGSTSAFTTALGSIVIFCLLTVYFGGSLLLVYITIYVSEGQT